jgi:hypothetical protein
MAKRPTSWTSGRIRGEIRHSVIPRESDATVEKIEPAGAEANVKVRAPSSARVRLFAQDAFTIDTRL